MLACAEKSAKIRKAEEKAKTNMLVKQKLSIDSNGKLANCESRKAQDCEIFIVEEILLVVLQKQQEIERHRQSFQFEEKS